MTLKLEKKRLKDANITNTVSNPRLPFSVPYRDYRQLSCSMETGKMGDRHHRRLEGDHVPVPAVNSGFAKGECGLISEHVHCRLACCKPVMYCFLTLVFSAYSFVLAGHK